MSSDPIVPDDPRVIEYARVHHDHRDRLYAWWSEEMGEAPPEEVEEALDDEATRRTEADVPAETREAFEEWTDGFVSRLLAKSNAEEGEQ